MEAELYGKIKTSIKRLLNIDLTYYKDEQMRRRLDSWLIRSGAQNWDLYLSRLNADSTELRKFRDYLTINVSEFFRDPERWQSLRANVLPDLLKEAVRVNPPRGGLRVWSAGCSIGPEAYTLAILLDEIAPGREHTIVATDLDKGALAKAKAGGPYIADDIRNVAENQRATYFEPGGPPFTIKPRFAQRIRFQEQNLLTDPFEKNFDLIVCRNVIIYFTTEAKASLYQKFHAALRPGGVLFLGGTEIIPRPIDIGFQNQSVSFYYKVG